MIVQLSESRTRTYARNRVRKRRAAGSSAASLDELRAAFPKAATSFIGACLRAKLTRKQARCMYVAAARERTGIPYESLESITRWAKAAARRKGTPLWCELSRAAKLAPEAYYMAIQKANT